MKIDTTKLTIILCSVILFTQSVYSAMEKDFEVSQAMFSPSHHEFGNVPEGTIVTHTFEIQNKCGAVLNLSKPYASCTCLTIGEYDEQIPSNAVGTVSVSFDTDGYGTGKRISREGTFATNDPNRPELRLTMAGVVEKVYTITPKIGKLTGKVNDDIRTTIIVFPEEKYAFKILSAKAKKGSDIEYTIEEIEQNGKKGYALKIKNIRKEKGLFFDKIFLSTDSDVVPEIPIGIFGKIDDA